MPILAPEGFQKQELAELCCSFWLANGNPDFDQSSEVLNIRSGEFRIFYVVNATFQSVSSFPELSEEGFVGLGGAFPRHLGMLILFGQAL